MASNGVVKTFDPNRVVITYGATIFTDYADGTFISVTSENNFEDVRGADGSLNRINKNVNDVTVEVTLSQTSTTNDLLSSQLIVDRSTNEGKNPLTIKDLSGTTLIFSPQAWIVKFPDSEGGDSLSTRTWQFRGAFASVLIGSNI